MGPTFGPVNAPNGPIGPGRSVRHTTSQHASLQSRDGYCVFPRVMWIMSARLRFGPDFGACTGGRNYVLGVGVRVEDDCRQVLELTWIPRLRRGIRGCLKGSEGCP
jgi:hypothetical protein